jgi:translation elongation factor EF-Tu-like GTPase
MNISTPLLLGLFFVATIIFYLLYRKHNKDDHHEPSLHEMTPPPILEQKEVPQMLHQEESSTPIHEDAPTVATGPATFQILDGFDLFEKGIVLTGVLQSGTIHKGMHGMLNGKPIEVQNIELSDSTVETYASTGSHIGVLVHGIDKADILPGVVEFS